MFSDADLATMNLVRCAFGALELRAWMPNATPERRPAVVFVHGGSAFGAEDWALTRPFRGRFYAPRRSIARESFSA